MAASKFKSKLRKPAVQNALLGRQAPLPKDL